MPKYLKLFMLVFFINVMPLGVIQGAELSAGGKPLSDAEIEKWAITIYPDGRGLPKGQGTALGGEKVYQDQCIACHGENGKAGVATRLSGREGYPKGSADLLRTLSVGAWPYATTIYDYVRRAMPHVAPKTLSDDEVYELTAYILHLNGLGKKDQILDQTSLPQIEMPNKKRAVNIWELNQN